MIKIAGDKLPENAKLYLGDANHLPFKTESFDLLICTDSFHHYPNPQVAIDKFYRVLKNEGYLLPMSLKS